MANWLYISDSRDGWRNLAQDEYFLDHIGPEDMLLYFYINRAAVIIGRGQNPWAECNLSAMERDNVQLVRRITGGGAVFHDAGNLNFSFIAGEKLYDVPRQLNMILSAVKSLGIPCEFSGRNDLLAGGRKFSGNAFCARKEIRQHHGTLLIRSDLGRLQNYLNVDPQKLQAKGVKSVRSRVCNLSEFAPELSCEKMLSALQDAYQAEYGAYSILPAPEEAQLGDYLKKHASDAWRLGETPRFDVEFNRRFAWGGIQILLTLRKGRVDEVRAYTDALDEALPEKIASCLAGVEYRAEKMAAALMENPGGQMKEIAEWIRSSMD